jgi:hypothetical protein
MNWSLPQFRLSTLALVVAVVVMSCALPRLGFSSAAPWLGGIAMAAVGVALFYWIGLGGVAPREVFGMVVFWAAAILQNTAARSLLNKLDEAVFVVKATNFLKYFCVLAVAVSCVVRCWRTHGSIWPFVHRNNGTG